MKKKPTVPRVTRAEEHIGVPARREEPGLPKHEARRITGTDFKPGHHLCFLYETEEEHRALITPFLRQGLQRGEKVIYAAHAHTVESVLAYLREDGLEVGRYLARGQLSVVPASSTYLREGVFNPEELVPLMRAETERALAEGHAGLRATGEMSWALEEPPGSDRLVEYEARINASFPGSKFLGLCQYDRRRFSPPVLLNILYTHPVVAVGRRVYDNFYYLPPEAFLGEEVPATVVHHCIENLATRRGLEEELSDAREQLRMVFQKRILERWKASEALALSSPSEKPSRMRFEISCPVTTRILTKDRGWGLERGKLLDIGDGGARFSLARPLPTGTRLVLDVHLPAPKEQVITMRFEGVVARAQDEPPYEVVVQFRRRGRILRKEPGHSADHQTD